MIECKVMSGKNVLSRLPFESDFNDCKSIFVISDFLGNVSGEVRKIKKSFSKEVEMNVFKVKWSNYAQKSAFEECLKKAIQVKAEMIVCVGSEVAFSLGKAVKFALAASVDSFDNLLMAKSLVGIHPSKQIILAYVVTALSGHEQDFTGRFQIKDNKENIIYSFSKQEAKADIVMVDEKLLDKLSYVGMLGLELGVLATGLIALSNCDEPNKISARAAIKSVGCGKPTLCDLYVAQMSAGFSFYQIENNLLAEAVYNIKRKSDVSFTNILILLLKKSFCKLVDNLSSEDINFLGNIYQIADAQDNVMWKQSLCNVIEGKLNYYFEDKDIPKCLNEIGLNSDDIEEIFAELEEAFGNSESLARLKDLAYSAY